MTPTSTARFIMYDLRPSKQIERKLVFDTISQSSGPADDCASLPFIGMGRFRFVDFIVANKFLATQNFVSIEHDAGIIPRCEYNKPFNNISMCNETVHEFLLKGGARHRAIVWLDYESGLTENMLDEIQLLTGTVLASSYIFVTCKALPDRSLSGSGTRQVRAFYEDQLGSFALNFPEADYSRKRFTQTAALLLRNMLADGFQPRPDGIFAPYLRLIYNDSNPMITVGGYFGSTAKAASVTALVNHRFGFLKPDLENFVYDIGGFNLTEPERRLFNRAALSPGDTSPDLDKLRALGFRDDEVVTYRDLMRYVPRYFEALL